MHKGDLVDAIAKDADLSKADAGRALDALVETVERALKKGEEVSITGFGKFSVAKRPAREGRNPQTGESMKIKASKAPTFSAGAPLKRAVNNGR